MQIKVLDHDVDVVFIDEKDWGREAFGDFDCHKLRIRIVKNLHPAVMMGTLLHELTHVKQFLFGKEMSEDEANNDAIFYMSLLSGNKDLMKSTKHYEQAHEDAPKCLS